MWPAVVKQYCQSFGSKGAGLLAWLLSGTSRSSSISKQDLSHSIFLSVNDYTPTSPNWKFLFIYFLTLSCFLQNVKLCQADLSAASGILLGLLTQMDRNLSGVIQFTWGKANEFLIGCFPVNQKLLIFHSEYVYFYVISFHYLKEGEMKEFLLQFQTTFRIFTLVVRTIFSLAQILMHFYFYY